MTPPYSHLAAQHLQEGLAFLDRQMLKSPSVNDQIGFDFQGLRRSFQENPRHPDSKMVAHFGRIWIYDIALAIYADLKAGRLRQASYQAGRLMQLALKEEEKGFKGFLHFSYNTREDTFIDARGPTGANAWCLNALYAYILKSGDASLLKWTNRVTRDWLFSRQVLDPPDSRYGLIRAGLHNADEAARGEAMGYQVYEGDLNSPYEHVILEHCADAAGTFRLAYRATRRLFPGESRFLEELIHRHDLLMRGVRRRFWQEDHFVTALDAAGQLCKGTDGQPSVAVDNNTWSAHVFLPYDLDLARKAIRYVEERFALQAPPGAVEDVEDGADPTGLKGVYYFPSSFWDPFVEVPAEHRAKMERIFQPEAAYGFAVFLFSASDSLAESEEGEGLRRRAWEIYENAVRLQRLYGPSGAPYASANVPAVFSTLHSVTTAATSVIVSAILQGSPADDFIGVLPPLEFTVEGRPPLKHAS